MKRTRSNSSIKSKDNQKGSDEEKGKETTEKLPLKSKGKEKAIVKKEKGKEPAKEEESAKGKLFTVGHSTHSIEDFLSLLKAHQITQLVDVRTIPGSRKYPHFGQEQLSGHLFNEGIEYLHMKSLGGLRKPKKDSINTAWRNDSFRGYADYMASEEFENGLLQLISMVQGTADQ